MAAMQALWSKPVGEDDQDPQPLQESGPSTSQPFQVFTDSTDTAETQKSSPFEIFCDENKPSAEPAPFAIYCDENAGVPKKLPSVRRQTRAEIANRDEDKENSPVGTDDEDRENLAPAGYRQPHAGARSKSGILTEAENVEFVPLDVQEKMLDEEEKQDQRDFEVFKSPKSKIKSVNKPDVPRPFGGRRKCLTKKKNRTKGISKFLNLLKARLNPSTSLTFPDPLEETIPSCCPMKMTLRVWRKCAPLRIMAGQCINSNKTKTHVPSTSCTRLLILRRLIWDPLWFLDQIKLTSLEPRGLTQLWRPAESTTSLAVQAVEATLFT